MRHTQASFVMTHERVLVENDNVVPQRRRTIFLQEKKMLQKLVVITSFMFCDCTLLTPFLGAFFFFFLFLHLIFWSQKFSFFFFTTTATISVLFHQSRLTVEGVVDS